MQPSKSTATPGFIQMLNATSINSYENTGSTQNKEI